MTTKRVFLGINPPDKTKKKVYEATKVLRELSLNVKWVEKENLHLTFEFLGYLEEKRVERLKGLKQRVRGKPILIGLGQVMAFPSRQAPRVVYVDIDKGKEELMKLHQKVRKWLINNGYDLKRSSLHLTLGRFRKPPSKSRVKKFWKVAERLDFSAVSWEVGQLTLFESHLTPKGPKYEVLELYNLLPF